MSQLRIKLSQHATILVVLLYATCHIGSAKNCEGFVNMTQSNVQPFCQNGTMVGKQVFLAGGTAYAECACNVTNTGSGNVVVSNINGEESNCSASIYNGIMEVYECSFTKKNYNITFVESMYLERKLGKLIEDEFSFCLKLWNTLDRDIAVTCQYPIGPIQTTPIPTTTTPTTTTKKATTTTTTKKTTTTTTTTTTKPTTPSPPTTSTHPHVKSEEPVKDEGGSMIGIIVGVVVGVLLLVVVIVVGLIMKKKQKVETV